uniref:Uncharacterized protein n=1 Tax=Anguilla anguilla TaxID=7936 RepID=A0A0E9WE31_ANGAN
MPHSIPEASPYSRSPCDFTTVMRPHNRCRKLLTVLVRTSVLT